MRFEIFVDPLRRYRWRLVDDHSTEIAVSADGYYNRLACERWVELVRTFAATADVCDCTRESGPRSP